LRKAKQRLKQCQPLFGPLKVLKRCFWERPAKILSELASWWRSFHRLQGLDFLVVPGSGAITDWWEGPWNHPYLLLRWAVLAKLTGTKIIALSIGAERLNTRLGKRFAKWALSIAAYRSFRDRYSRTAIEAYGLKGPNPVFPDQGFALPDLLDIDATASIHSEIRQPGAGLIVGVTPIGEGPCVQPGMDDSSHQRYIQNLATFVLWLIQNGYRIAFCPSDVKDGCCAPHIMDKIRGLCSGTDWSSRIIDGPILTMKDLVARILLCDLIVSSRFHGVVLPLALQKPVLGISYYERKIADVMSQCGQGAYHLRAEEADVQRMISAFESLEKNRHAIARHLGSVVSELRAGVNRQYKEVFGRFQ
jgi:polysaccharide pyruvyl transferase WcaK-like protein